MLTLRAAKGSDYYERAEFARDDYYAEQGQVRGSWVGSGADALGLSGHPAEGALGVLLDGRDPSTGAPLSGAARRHDGNVAFDLTFAAPKSVSVLAAVGDERVRHAVLRAHAHGVQAALAYLEREACFVRRGHNGLTVLPAQGFVGAAYLHEMARSGDPHLHAHVVIANRVRGEDGRWSAPDMRPVYAHAKTAGTIADAVMRASLTQSLGVEWGPVVNGIAELVAVPKNVREHFSARHAEIMEEALARGYTSPAALAVIQRETRDTKRVVSRERAVTEWRARAAEHGFGERELARAMGRARQTETRDYHARLTANEERMLGPAGLTKQSSTFTRRDVIQALAGVHPEGATPGLLERLADDFLARTCVPLTRDDHSVERGRREAAYTTPDMLRAEVRLMEIAIGRDPVGSVVADPGAIEAAILRRATMGTDQEAAVRHLTSGDERVRVMEARAGTGKTFTLQAVREAYERSGTPVIGVAWQGQAADVLQRDAGIPSQTATLLLQRIARGDPEAIPLGAVIVVDEAAMMPTRALEQLTQEAAWRRARLVLVGDRAQLPAIDAAGGFATLADRLGAVELTENRRQRTGLQRQVAERLSQGRAHEALELLADSGRLRGFTDARDARAALIDSWARTSLLDPAAGLILAHDRHGVRLLNEMARARRELAGLLGPITIVAEGREWAAGDQLVCRRNDYALGVRNGTRGTVTHVDRNEWALVLRTDDGQSVRLPSEYLEHAHHGYALTGHVSQGTTVERTYLLATPERGGKEWAYVAGSRQRLDLEVYAVHHEPDQMVDALARAWSRSDAKSLALDLVEPTERARAIDGARADLTDRLPERVVARVAELQAAREQARAVAGSVPDLEIARVAELRAAVARAHEGAREAGERLERLSAKAEATPVWRRGARAEVRSAARNAERDLERHRATRRKAQGELARLGPMRGRVAEVERARTAARELGGELRQVEARLGAWEDQARLARSRPSLERARGRPGIERGIGRGR